MAQNTNSDQKIRLESNEGNTFECKLEAAKMSQLIKDMIAVLGIDTASGDQKPVPLKNEAVTDEALKNIIEWVEYYYDDLSPDEDFEEEKDRCNEELSYSDKTFIDVPDQGHLFDIIAAANYLDIKGLVEVGAKHICNKIKDKTCAEVREILKITNDFTPEE